MTAEEMLRLSAAGGAMPTSPGKKTNKKSGKALADMLRSQSLVQAASRQ
jgi:hypothetical protein